MRQSLLIALALIGVAVVLLLIALPKAGEVVGFLRRDAAQVAYSMAIILLLVTGVTLTLFGP